MNPFIVPKQPHIVQQIICFVLLLPLTLICFFVMIVCIIPIFPIYRHIQPPIKHVLMRFAALLILSTLRIYPKITDHTQGKTSRILVSNHVSIIDSLLFFYHFGHLQIIAAGFTKDHVIFGPLTKVIEPIFVEQKRGTTLEKLKQAYEKNPYPILIFSEGVFSNGTGLLQFQRGAFVLREPITPILLQYSEPTPYWNHQESNFLTQLFRILSRLYTPVDVRIFSLYYPSDEEKVLPEIFAEQVRMYLAQKGSLVLYDINYKSSPNYVRDTQNKRT